MSHYIGKDPSGNMYYIEYITSKYLDNALLTFAKQVMFSIHEITGKRSYCIVNLTHRHTDQEAVERIQDDYDLR